MKFELETTSVQCPYCWESFDISLDCSSIQSAGEVQQYTEDCYVCCRPIVISVTLSESGQPDVQIEAELA